LNISPSLPLKVLPHSNLSIIPLLLTPGSIPSLQITGIPLPLNTLRADGRSHRGQATDGEEVGERERD